MKRNGFTLIELLAVIVILAIIALIAVPIVLNLINNSKEQAVKISAEHYFDAVEQAIAREYLKDSQVNLDGTYMVEEQGKKLVQTDAVQGQTPKEITVEYDGEAVLDGIIEIKDSKVSKAEGLKINNYTVKLESGKITLLKDGASNEDNNGGQEPGSGTGDLSRAAGLYKEDGTYISWEELINNGTISYSDGILQWFNGYDQTTWEPIVGELVISADITSIDSSAFQGSGLTSVEIPSSVTSIGNYAFADCMNLVTVTIPSSVVSIGDEAFTSCANLKEINVDVNNTNYSSENGVLYNKNKTTLMQYPVGKTEESFIIPDSVTNIGDQAFSSCESLVSVTIPNSVISIGQSAFRFSNITEITIPSSVTSIEESAFLGTGLTSVVIPYGVTSIGDSAFQSCNSLTSVEIPSSVTSIGSMSFYGTDLTTVTIPSSVTSIGDEAFSSCDNLKEINVDTNNANYSSVNGVLYNKNKTALLQYPSGKTEGSFTIPNGVTSISYGAFKSCKSLTTVTIPEGVTSIGDWAFTFCSNLTLVTIPEDVTSIGAYTFYETGLTQITIPASVTSIGTHAFSYTDLTTVTIENGVTNIGDYAFFECWNLTSAIIPESVTRINQGAFMGCSNLAATIQGNNVTVEGGAFYSVPIVYYNGYVEGTDYSSWEAVQVLPLQ